MNEFSQLECIVQSVEDSVAPCDLRPRAAVLLLYKDKCFSPGSEILFFPHEIKAENCHTRVGCSADQMCSV